MKKNKVTQHEEQILDSGNENCQVLRSPAKWCPEQYIANNRLILDGLWLVYGWFTVGSWLVHGWFMVDIS